MSYAAADAENVARFVEALRTRLGVEAVGPSPDWLFDDSWTSAVRAAVEESVGTLVWITPTLANSTGAHWAVAEAIKQGRPVLGIRTSSSVPVPNWLRAVEVASPEAATAEIQRWITSSE